MSSNKELFELAINKMQDEGNFLISSGACSNMAEMVMYLVSYSNNNPTKDITLYITANYPDFTTMTILYDAIKSISNPIGCVVMGKICNYAALIAASCKKGRRFALEHARFALDQPSGVLDAGANLETEISIAAKEAKSERDEFERLLALETGQPLEKIHNYIQDEVELHAKEAIELGIIDKVI